jgi:hypothetical protein
MQENDYMPFRFTYSSRDAAAKAVEENAKEDHESFEPDTPFEGLDWSDDETTAFIDIDDCSAGYWVIQETELQP